MYFKRKRTTTISDHLNYMNISIITPSYNQAQFLEKSILSIWNQTGKFTLEHIIADGGSNDESIEIIKHFERLYLSGSFQFKCKSFKFIWWSEKDSGQSYAINKGFMKLLKLSQLL